MIARVFGLFGLCIAVACGSENVPSEAIGDSSSVSIAGQVWMTENLNVSIFRNGDSIPEARTAEDWYDAGDEGRPAWCYYANSVGKGQEYGKLYNWYAASDPRGLAPIGWHVPSDQEWSQLANHLGGENGAGMKMKNTSGWSEDGNGTNESGFAGLPGNERSYDGQFSSDAGAIFWSATEVPVEDRNLPGDKVAWYRSLGGGVDLLYRGNTSKSAGLSVRCVRD